VKLSAARARTLLFVPLLCIAWHQSLSQEKPQENSNAAAAPGQATSSAPERQNPVKPTPENLAEAKKFFGFDCAMCHGASGPKGSARPACPFAVARLQFITALSDASARASCREDALAQHWKCCGATTHCS
jgi:hypothetical protein